MKFSERNYNDVPEDFDRDNIALIKDYEREPNP